MGGLLLARGSRISDGCEHIRGFCSRSSAMRDPSRARWRCGRIIASPIERRKLLTNRQTFTFWGTNSGTDANLKFVPLNPLREAFSDHQRG
jgi:hypothetical protein